MSNAGVLISRDGTIRTYEGHSNKKGAVLGLVTRAKGLWLAECVFCSAQVTDYSRYDAVDRLSQHRRAKHEPR